MTLAEIYQTFLGQMGPGGASPITIDDASLGTTDVDALLRQTIGAAAISVTVLRMNPPTTELVVVGTSSFLVGPTGNGFTDGANLPVTITIVETTGGIGLNVVVNLAALAPPWSLGQSFYAWLGTVYDDPELISQPQLVFTNYAQSYAGPPAISLVPGLNLAAVIELSVTGPLGLLALLFAASPDEVVLAGTITFTPPGPVFLLSAPLPDVKAPIGPALVTGCELQLSLAWFASGDLDYPYVPFPNSQFLGKTSIVSSHPPTSLLADLVPGSNTLILQFTGDPTTGIVSTSDLEALLASYYPGFANAIPWTTIGAGSMPPIGLLDLGLTALPGALVSGAFPLLTVWATVATLKPWQVIPQVDQFIIQQLGVRWTVVAPASATRGVFATAFAALTIGSYTFDVEVTFPDLVVAGQLPGGVTLGLSDVSANFFSGNVPANPDLSQSSVSFGELSFVVAPMQRQFRVACSITANLAFAGIDLELQGGWLSLSAAFNASTQYVFLVGGLVTIQQWPFLVSAAITNAGMLFTGTLTQPRTLHVSDLIGSLLSGVGVPPPSFDLEAEIEQFGVALDTGVKTYEVGGDIAWTLEIAGLKLTPDTVFFVKSAVDPTSGQRVWSGAVGATFPIAGLTFTTSYQFGPQVSRLVGTLTSGAYDPNGIGQAFGTAIPALPPSTLPSFGLLEVSLFYDFVADDLVLQGTAPVSGGSVAGFLELQGGGSTGFTFGIGIQDSGTFFTSISPVLAPIDDLGLTGLTIVLSNLPPGTAYSVPLPSFNGYRGVYPGINVYATFAWGQTSNAGLQYARGVLSPTTATLAVLAAFYEWSGTATFVLAGRIQNLALDFSTWNLVIDYAEMRLSLTASDAGEQLALQFLLQLTYTPGSGSYLPLPSPSNPNPAPQPPNLVLTGMLEIVEDDGDFGAFLGASMVGTWQDALGFSGLDISNLGVVIGIDAEGIPSFGFTGMVTYDAFFGWITIFFDSVNPAESMFGGAFSDLLLGNMLQFCLPGINVPSSLMGALNEFGLEHTTPATIDGLTTADFEALAAGTVSATLATALAAHGDQLAPQTGTFRTVIVSPFTDPATGNPAWYIANTPNMATVTLVADGPIASATSAQLSWNVQIYVAPTTVTPFPNLTFQQGYRFDGRLLILGWALEVNAFVNPSKGVYLGAYADPILFPSDGSLLSITAVDDATQGPWLSLSTFDYADPKFPYSTGPHFGLSAEIDLLGFDKSKLQVLILSSGLSFEYAVSLGDPNGSFLAATFDCTYGNSELKAAASFVAQLYLEIPALRIDGVQITPAISAKIFSVSATLGLDITGSACTVDANVTLDLFGMSLSVGFSFPLPGMGQLISSLATGIIDNLQDLLAPLWKDAVAWARAMASAGLDALEDLGATLKYFFEGDFTSAAHMLAQLGKDVEEISQLLQDVWSLPMTMVLHVLTEVFQLKFQYAGVGRGIGPAGTPSVTDLISWMQTTARPAFAAGTYAPLLEAGAGALGVFDATMVQIVRVSAALSDPDLYAMAISLDVDDTTLLSIPLGYQKLADGQGVFTASLAPPDAWRSRSFGPFGFQLPAIELSVFTSGDWVIDVGFPFDNDWSGAAKLQMPFFSGQGGFYLGRPPAGSVAPFGAQQVTALLGMGIAARMSIGGSLDIGILSGGIQVTFTGIVQGYVGFGGGISSSAGDKSMFANPAAIVLEGVFNLSGLVYGSVDFGIVSASVHIALSASLMLVVKNGVPADFSFDVSVSVSVDVRIHLLICTITVSFSFDVTFSYGPVIDWSSSAALRAPLPPLPPRTWAPLRAERAADLCLATGTTLTVYLAPEVTLVFGATGAGAANAVANLAIGYTPGDASAPFNQLVQALLVWATQHDGGPAPVPGTISLAEVTYLLQELQGSVGDPSSVLDYDKLVAFLSATFAVTVAPAPTTTQTSAVYFPMIPDLTLWATGQGGATKPVQIVDFAAVNLRDASYVKAVLAQLAAMRVMGGPGGGTIVLPASPISIATMIFETYFAMLIQRGAQALSDAMTAAGTTSMTAAQLAAFDFQQLAGAVATAFRGGLELPFDATPQATPTALAVLTGQQYAVDAPASVTSYAISVAPGAKGGWLTVAPGAVALDLVQLAAYAKLAVDPPLAQGVQLADALAARPAVFVFPTAGWQTFAQPGGAAWSIGALPATLDTAAGASGIAVAMQTLGAGGAPTPLAPPFAWATALTVVVQRVPDPTTSSGFAAGVYEIVASDPRQFAAIDGLTAWLGATSTASATPALLYVDPATGNATPPAAPAASIVLLRTNTTTESHPPTTARLRAAPSLPYAAAFTAADAVAVMSIVKEYGIVNASGYYLAVPSVADAPGLPDALFAAGPTTTLTILLTRGPAPAASGSTVLASDTSLVLQGAPPAGQPVTAAALSAVVYQATQQPGTFAVTAARANPGTDTLQAALDTLYNLFTAQLTGGGGYQASPFASPVGPQRAAGSDATTAPWSYLLAIPAARFLPAAAANPYLVIGTAPELAFQIRDSFGNVDAPASATQTFTLRYTDPLTALGSWRGTSLGWSVGTAATTLVVQLAAVASDFAGLSAADLANLLGLWQTIAWQAADPNVAFSVATSLDPRGAQLVGSAAAPYQAGSPTLVAFAQGVLAYLQALSAGTAPPPLPATVSIAYAIGAPAAATPPYAIGVELAIARTRDVDPQAAARLPEVALATTAIPVAMPAGGTAALAAAFEAGFATLKLATGASRYQQGELWAVDRALTALTIGAAIPSYFAPAPLEHTLQGGTVLVPTWSFSGGGPYPPTNVPYTYANTDLDAIAIQMFVAIDGLLAGPFAAAAYAVAPDDYTSLVALRGQLAQGYAANQIEWLFDEQIPQPPPALDTALWAARATFSDDLRASLAAAYAIDAVVQYPVTCGAAPSTATAGLSLSGTVQSAPGGSPTFPGSTVKLRLPSSAGYLGEGAMSINYRPNATGVRSVDYALQYQITNLAFGDDPTNPLAEPTWLVFPLPVTVPLAPSTTVPIVVRQFPTPPVLVAQTFAPYATADDPAFLDQLAWDYQYQLLVTPNAADTITTTIQFNTTPGGPMLRATDDALSLADAVVRFQQGYRSLAPVLGLVIQAAASTDPTLHAQATAILDGLVDLVGAVVGNSTWAGGAGLRARATAERVDTYTVEFAATATAGQWQMTVAIAPGGTGDLASIVPVPLTGAGAPQPGTGAPVYTADAVTVVYTPADPAAPLIAQLALDQLSVLTLESAWSTVSLTRNADLLAGFTTADEFVYQTPPTSFPDRVTPLLAGPAAGFDIAALTGMASGTLAAYLNALLVLMFEPGGVAVNNTPVLAVTAGYGRPVFAGVDASGRPQTARSLYPRVMSAATTLACTGTPAPGQVALADFAAGIAADLAAWLAANPVDRTTGELVFALALYASRDSAATALVALPNLTLALAALTG